MTKTEFDQLHCGDLIKLKSPIYWYSNEKWDEIEERFSIVLEHKSLYGGILVNASTVGSWQLSTRLDDIFLLKLLIDGSVQWFRATHSEIEIL